LLPDTNNWMDGRMDGWIGTAAAVVGVHHWRRLLWSLGCECTRRKTV